MLLPRVDFCAEAHRLFVNKKSVLNIRTVKVSKKPLLCEIRTSYVSDQTFDQNLSYG